MREAYLDAVDPANLEPLDPLRTPCIVLEARGSGTTRIIDNLTVAGPDGANPLIGP